MYATTQINSKSLLPKLFNGRREEFFLSKLNISNSNLPSTLLREGTNLGIFGKKNTFAIDGQAFILWLVWIFFQQMAEPHALKNKVKLFQFS